MCSASTPTRLPAVRWRADAADQSLSDLLAQVAHPPAGALPAIVAGGEIADGDMLTYNLKHLSVRPVASARWFPGYHNGAPLVIVDRDALVRQAWRSARRCGCSILRLTRHKCCRRPASSCAVRRRRARCST